MKIRYWLANKDEVSIDCNGIGLTLALSRPKRRFSFPRKPIVWEIEYMALWETERGTYQVEIEPPESEC